MTSTPSATLVRPSIPLFGTLALALALGASPAEARFRLRNRILGGQGQATYCSNPSPGRVAAPGQAAVGAAEPGGAPALESLSEAEYQALGEAQLPEKNYAQSENYRLETASLDGRTYTYWIKWEGGGVKAYELAGGHLTGRYQQFPSFDAFYAWRKALGADPAAGYAAWAQAWDGARFSDGLQSPELATALTGIRGRVVVTEAPPAPDGAGATPVPEVPSTEGAGLFGFDAATAAVAGAAAGTAAETPAETPGETPAGPSTDPKSGAGGEDDPGADPWWADPTSDPWAVDPDSEASPSDQVADPQTVHTSPAGADWSPFREQLAAGTTRIDAIQRELGDLSVEEGRLSRQVREAREHLTTGAWFESFIDRKVQRQREGWQSTIESGTRRLEQIEAQRRRLWDEQRGVETRRTDLEAEAGRLPVDPPAALGGPPPEILAAQQQVQVHAAALAAIDQRLGELSSEEVTVSRTVTAARERLTTGSWFNSWIDGKVQRQRESAQAQVDHGTRRLAEIAQERRRLQQDFHRITELHRQAEAEVGRLRLGR